MSEEKQTYKEQELRIAMAINRGVEYLRKVQKETPSSGKIDGASLSSYILGLYTNAHDALFQDWLGNKTSSTSERIEDPKKRRQLENAILEVLFGIGNDEQPEKLKLFDSNGYAITHSRTEFAEILANLYEKIREIKPYEYGNKLTTDFFITALSKFPPVQSCYDYDVDFRRLDKDDIQALQDEHPNKEAIKEAFLHATDRRRSKKLNNKENGFKAWENKAEYVDGVPFLSAEHNGTKCLVTVNGGLVPLDKVKQKLKDHFASNNLISDLEPISKSDIIGYLDGTESLINKTDIDGIKVADGNAPLLCLDINILTGLRSSSHNELEKLIKAVDGEKAKITNLNQDKNDHRSKENFLEKYLDAANGDPRLRRIVEIAYDHININVKRMDEFVSKEIDKTTEVKNPSIYFSMGGCGSGKSNVEKITRHECNNNYIKASLDDFRENSDLHKVLVSAGHHADDYKLINPYTSELREWITERALEKKRNILYDGTGVDFSPRYAELAEKFKKNGYHTEVVAIETNLPEATRRVVGRFDNEEDIIKKRALPWRVTAEKHIRFPNSFLDATSNKNVDKISLITSDGEPMGNDFIVAESFDVSRIDIKSLERAKNNEALNQKLGEYLLNEKSVLAKLPSAFPNSNPDRSNDNSSFLTYRNIGEGGNADRVLTIYNVDKFSQMLSKGRMNPDASSVKGFEHTPDQASFVMREEVRKQTTAKPIIKS